MRGWRAAALLLAGALLSAGCAGTRRPTAAEGAGAAWFGVYRGVYRETGGKPRRFRLLLFLEAPDRVHAEILPPVGGPVAILDAGGGRASLAFLRERVAYVGPSDDRVFRAWMGIPLGPPEFVAAARTGLGAPSGVRVERLGPAGGGLPQRLTVAAGTRWIRINMRRRRRVTRPAVGPRPGTGEPPPGFELRSFDQLPGDLEPAVAGHR